MAHTKFLKLKSAMQLALVFVFFLTASHTNAQPSQCIRVDQIAKWEVLDSTKTLTYDNQGNAIAFIVFRGYPDPELKKNGESFRFFSSSICRYDRVQITGGMTTVTSIEPIRK